MMASVLSNMRPFLRGYVIIRSDEALDVVAQKLSDRLLKGIPFGGQELRIRDEIPAMFTELLGLRFVLQGDPIGGYLLSCAPSISLRFVEPYTQEVDISEQLILAIGNISGATISRATYSESEDKGQA